MNYGLKKYKEEPKIRIRVESTRMNESVKTFSIYSKHGNGRMMLRTSRGVMVSTDGHTIRSTAFKPKKIYDVIEILEEVKEVDFEKTVHQAKETLILEVEKLNKLKESDQTDTADRELIQVAINKMGEAFQSLDKIF